MNAELERLTRKHRAFLRERTCAYGGCRQPVVCRVPRTDGPMFFYYCANHKAVIETFGTETQPITTIERQYDRT